MRIIDLLSREAVELNASVSDKSDAIERLIFLHERVGNLNNVSAYRQAILAREAQGSTAIGNGIAVPHAKSDSVRTAALSFISVPDGVDFNSPDGSDSRLIFMIAAPPDGDLHIEILSRLMTMLMDEGFRSALETASTPDELIDIIDRSENERYPDNHTAKDNGISYRVLAVTACPTGIAHTFMAAEALEAAGKRLGLHLKAEANGSAGIENALTAEEIAGCDGVIIAADRSVEMARFDGKPVIMTSTSAAINKPDELINKIIDGKAGIYHTDESNEAEASTDGEGIGRQIYKHLMNGVSHMLPFVVGGGVLIALAFLIDTLAGNADVGDSFGYTALPASVVFHIGKAAFAFMLPVLSGYISQSIADRPGLLPGMLGGYLAATGATVSAPAGADSAVSGFLGALFAGFAAGVIVRLVKLVFSRMPKAMEGIKPVFIYPLFGTFFVGIVMLFVNPVIGILNTGLSSGLASLGNSSRILLSIVLAAMMAVDMGGPFNKAAYVFGTAAIADGNTWIMAAVMVGGMVPPIAIALSTTFNKNKWTDEEIKSGAVNYAMGLCFITEGAIPYAAADPLRVIPSCMVGSAVAGALSSVFGVGCPAPHGGIFTFAVCDNPIGYIIALIGGAAAGALMLAILKKNKEGAV